MRISPDLNKAKSDYPRSDTKARVNVATLTAGSRVSQTKRLLANPPTLEIEKQH